MSKYMNLTLKKWVKVKGHVIIGFTILTNIYPEFKIIFLSLIVSKLWVKMNLTLKSRSRSMVMYHQPRLPVVLTFQDEPLADSATETSISIFESDLFRSNNRERLVHSHIWIRVIRKTMNVILVSNPLAIVYVNHEVLNISRYGITHNYEMINIKITLKSF